jgi:hypothetical protein
LPALYWGTDKVGGLESKSVTTGKPISSQLQYGRLIQPALIRLDLLGLHVKLSSHLMGPHVRSDGPSDRSAGLLVGWTHLSVTVVSLVGGDIGVPMSHMHSSRDEIEFIKSTYRVYSLLLWIGELCYVLMPILISFVHVHGYVWDYSCLCSLIEFPSQFFINLLIILIL